MSVSLARPGLKRAILNGEELPAWLQQHCRRDYIIAVALSVPPWCDRNALNEIQKEARRRSLVTGIPHVVDHILPITHELVCGLTVPANLRVIPKAMNDRKSNRLDGELFDQPEQLRLL